MFSMITILITPPLLLFAIPLFLFALLTTFSACLVLGLRVSIVYVELFVSVVQNLLSPSRTLAPYLRKKISTPLIEPATLSLSSSQLDWMQPSSPTRTTRSLRRTSSTITSSSGPSSRSGNTTPKALSFGSGDTTNPFNRDYEGVGGWRMPATTEEAAEDEEREEELWTGMNKRLELPVPVPIVLQRSAASSQINLRQEPDVVDREKIDRGKTERHKGGMTGGASSMGQRVKDGMLRMTKHKGKEPERDVDPSYRRNSVGKERKHKSMVALGEAWTANVGRSMATAKRF